jgi:PRC-barrel domain protein
MKKTGIATLLLLAVATVATPASANWFFRPGAGVSLNVGSAPNPTPNDLRILYGPSRYSVYPTRISVEVLRDMTGKSVYGENGERLGMIATVDEASRLAELQLPDGRSVAVDANLLINEMDRVVAPTLSLAEVMARA